MTLVLSPHFDDAALSVAGVLGRIDGPKTVVTVHGGPPPDGVALSEWDARCGFVSPAEAYATRVAEDARACALLGAGQVTLPVPDGPYRAKERIAALDDFLGTVPDGTEVFVPLGTNQPDHARVRDQALGALADRAVALRLYADLPYTAIVAGWGTADLPGALATSAGHGAAYRAVDEAYGLRLLDDVRLDEGEWSRKRDAILCYASQLAPVAAMSESRDAGPLLGWPGPLRHEVIWTLAPS